MEVLFVEFRGTSIETMTLLEGFLYTKDSKLQLKSLEHSWALKCVQTCVLIAWVLGHPREGIWILFIIGIETFINWYVKKDPWEVIPRNEREYDRSCGPASSYGMNLTTPTHPHASVPALWEHWLILEAERKIGIEARGFHQEHRYLYWGPILFSG